MPALKAYWAKYGCTKCDKYKLLVLEFNPGLGTKQSYKTEYLDKEGVTYPAVWETDGGWRLSEALGNDLAGGPEYLIKPDKTFMVKYGPMTKSLVDEAGGNVQHVCTTGICSGSHQTGPQGIALYPLAAGRLSVTVRNADEYRITVCTTDGKLVSSVMARFITGSNEIRLPKSSASAQVVVVSVKGEKGAAACTAILSD